MEVGDELHLDHRRRPMAYKTCVPYNSAAREVRNRLLKRPPNSWYKIALISIVLVWASITMALLLAYNTPTIGLGCWSGSFLVLGVLSSVTWVLQFIRPQRPIRWIVNICTLFNLMSMAWLVTVVFLMVSKP
jgi:hypothetical protein